MEYLISCSSLPGGSACASKEAYVAAIKKAADALMDKRFLLAEDAMRLVAQAEREGIRSAP
jgi:hypothetical protein